MLGLTSTLLKSLAEVLKIKDIYFIFFNPLAFPKELEKSQGNQSPAVMPHPHTG